MDDVLILLGTQHRLHHGHAVLPDRHFCRPSCIQCYLPDKRAGAERNHPAGIAKSGKPGAVNTGHAQGGKGELPRLPQ